MSAPAQQPFSPNQPQNTVAHGSMHHSDGSYVPVIIVLSVITILSIASCILGHICSRGWNRQVPYDLEKGIDTVKTDATKSKIKEAVNSKIKPKTTTANKCELHGNKINHKKLVTAKTTASVTSKKQGLSLCEVHLSRHNNTSDLSGANDEEQASVNSN
jgi:hypothetical protein